MAYLLNSNQNYLKCLTRVKHKSGLTKAVLLCLKERKISVNEVYRLKEQTKNIYENL